MGKLEEIKASAQLGEAETGASYIGQRFRHIACLAHDALEEEMTPKRFAEMCKLVREVREASWSDEEHRYGRYALSYREAAEQAFPGDSWGQIIAVLLFPGYADVWDWVQEQGVELS